MSRRARSLDDLVTACRREFAGDEGDDLSWFRSPEARALIVALIVYKLL